MEPEEKYDRRTLNFVKKLIDNEIESCHTDESCVDPNGMELSLLRVKDKITDELLKR